MEYTTIGIDLGHCETTAAFPRQPNGNDGRYEVRRLVARNKDQVILTQIILTNQQMCMLSGKLRPTYSDLCQLGEIRIGNKLPVSIQDGEKFCYFKVPPKDFDKPYGNTEAAKKYGITHGQIMACYIYALTKYLFKYNDIDLNSARPENVVLLIGCPTTKDWTDPEAQSAYAELAKSATNVRDVRIVPESRAAMFSSVENEKNKISAIKGAAVFDFGSSTADCTYMLLGRRIIEFSWTLGASEIERQMTLEAYQSAVKSQGMFDVDMGSFAKIEDELRPAKERYYENQKEDGSDGHPMLCRFQTSGGGQDVYATILVNDELMEKVTGEKIIQVLCDSKTSKSGSWMSLCEAFFAEAKKKIQNSSYTVIDEKGRVSQQTCEIDTIVLTGGASNMGFVHELCRKVFDGVTIRVEDNPEYTVSNGLGWVAVSDESLDQCRIEARSYVDSVSECSFATLKKNIDENVFNKIKAIAEKCTQDWADAPGDSLTLGDLEKKITSTMEDSDIKAEIIEVCSDTIAEWKLDLSDTMEKAVNDQVKKLYSESVAKGIIIPPDIWKTLQASGINLDALNSENILNGIDVSSLGRQIAQWLILATAVAIGTIAGLPGILLGYFVGSVIALLSADGQMDKARSRRERQSIINTVKNQISGKKSVILKEFSAGLAAYEAEYSIQVDEALAVAFEIVTLKRFQV